MPNHDNSLPSIVGGENRTNYSDVGLLNQNKFNKMQQDDVFTKYDLARSGY